MPMRGHIHPYWFARTKPTRVTQAQGVRQVLNWWRSRPSSYHAGKAYGSPACNQRLSMCSGETADELRGAGLLQTPHSRRQITVAQKESPHAPSVSKIGNPWPRPYLNLFYGMLRSSSSKPGYSSVGRASDCRLLQQSDGPWFDSGWPDLRLAIVMLRANAKREAVSAGGRWLALACIRSCALGFGTLLRRWRLIQIAWTRYMTWPFVTSCAIPHVCFASSRLCEQAAFCEECAAKDEIRFVRPRASRVC